jgi:hypothetical protein
MVRGILVASLFLLLIACNCASSRAWPAACEILDGTSAAMASGYCKRRDVSRGYRELMGILSSQTCAEGVSLEIIDGDDYLAVFILSSVDGRFDVFSNIVHSGSSVFDVRRGAPWRARLPAGGTSEATLADIFSRRDVDPKPLGGVPLGEGDVAFWVVVRPAGGRARSWGWQGLAPQDFGFMLDGEDPGDDWLGQRIAGVAKFFDLCDEVRPVGAGVGLDPEL